MATAAEGERETGKARERSRRRRDAWLSCLVGVVGFVVRTVRAMGGSTNRKEYGSNQFVSRGGHGNRTYVLYGC
jgi:hypothetical protein